MQILADEWIGMLTCLDIAAEWKGGPPRFRQRKRKTAAALKAQR
jgi:hypothetical protein